MSEITTGQGGPLAYEESGSGPVLLFIHGWAMSGRVWRYQREEFSTDHRVITLDLRGHGSSAIPDAGPSIDDFAGDIETLMIRLDLRLVTLVAWSMGVSATLRAFPAIRHRLTSLIFVGGTPRFTSGDGFPHGLSPEESRGMALRLRRNYGRSMEDFFHDMFAEGELAPEQYRQIVQDILKGGRLPEPRISLYSLEDLAKRDLRPLLSTIDSPTLLIHGAEDRICLPGASRFMAESMPEARVELLPGIGHAPFLSHPALFNAMIREFMSTVPQSPVTSHQLPATGIDRRQVRSSFDRHADEYEEYAQVQRWVADQLMRLQELGGGSPRSLLDIGCGTGILLRSLAERYPHALVSGIDLAPGMVTAARAALLGRNDAEIRVGDAEQLPYADERFQLVVSTSTYQWLEQLSTAFGEVYRVLEAGGVFRFALFGERTLWELKESYRDALNRYDREASDRTHTFLGQPEVVAALAGEGFSEIRVWTELEIEYHPDVPALLRSLKRIGAGNASPDKPRSLAERRVMLTMMQLYGEKHGKKEGIPATYEVIYGEGYKI